MLVASNFLNKVTCTRNSVEAYSGDMYVSHFCSIMPFYKRQLSIYNSSICHLYVSDMIPSGQLDSY